MMDHVVGHLVRRGIDSHASFRASAAGMTEPEQYSMPPWGIAILMATFACFLLSLGFIDYTYNTLIGALAMIESPTAVIYEPVRSDEVDAPLGAEKDGAVVPELILVKQAPVTAKLCTAIRHLRDRAGFWSRFRGISIWMIYQFLLARLTNALTILGRHVGLSSVFAAVIAAVLLARLDMGWTHIIMSDPSPKRWYQRLPSWSAWRKVVKPTAFLALCQQLATSLPIGLWFAFGLSRFQDPQQFADLNNAERKLVILKGLAVILLGIFSNVAIVIPATVSLTRVQASLIPEEEETIVSFDRSFGGRVIPAVVGGSGSIGMLDAWKTFDWNSRIRLLKLYGKVFAMNMAASGFFIAVFIFELRLIMGQELIKHVMWAKASMNN